MSASSLHHLALGAIDLDAMARFYQTLLELRELKRHHNADGSLRSIWLELGSLILMLERSESPASQPVFSRGGVFLLAFPMRAAEREAWRQRLRRLGAAVESESEYSLYFRDPEGNRLAMTSYRA